MSGAQAGLLMVDDEPELRMLLAEYFQRHGYGVHTAADAAEARQHFASAPPAVAVLDVHMPGEDGLSLARWIREHHPRTGILMLTTAADTMDRVIGLEIGADDYLPKPFELRELLARVKSLLRRLALPATGPADAATPAPSAACHDLGPTSAWPPRWWKGEEREAAAMGPQQQHPATVAVSSAAALLAVAGGVAPRGGAGFPATLRAAEAVAPQPDPPGVFPAD